MKTYFITGAAQSVTNSVERFTAMRQHHPEWDDRPSEKAVTRERLARVAPVRPALGARSAARGAALLADGLAGGAYAPLVACLRLREARGGVLDHLRMYGARTIQLG